jgi:hypothetical protein
VGRLLSLIADTMDYDSKFEFEGFEEYKDHWRTLFEQYNNEMSDKTPCTSDQGTGTARRDRIIAKYQEVKIFLPMNLMCQSDSLAFDKLSSKCEMLRHFMNFFFFSRF